MTTELPFRKKIIYSIFCSQNYKRGTTLYDNIYLVCSFFDKKMLKNAGC